MRSEVHTEVINWIIQKKWFRSYLELGVHEPQYNFDLIKCKLKLGVDINGKASFTGTTDEFFELLTMQLDWQLKWDCVFIDALHHADQVKKDFDNSLQCLNDNGIILIHDTSPEKEEFAQVPRNGLRGRWNGDVWKFAANLYQYPVEWKTIKEDANGLTVVKIPETHVPVHLGIRGERDWDYFTKNKESFLNLCTRKEFEEWV